MNIEEIRNYCLEKRGVTEDTAFGPNTVLFRLCGKIFSCIDLNRPNLVVLRLEEEENAALRARYHGVSGAWHWNKRYWNDVELDSDVPEPLIRELLDHSYEGIKRKLPKKSLYHFPDLPNGWKHEHFPVLDSAMIFLRSAESQIIKEEYLLVSTDYQTAGRGQGSNTWESESGKNLLFAFRFFPRTITVGAQFQLLQCISVAVAMALEKFYKKTVHIKWPNDIYCGDRKICGILIEHDLQGQYLMETRCGIGININQQIFTGDAPNPVSLSLLLGKMVDRAAVLRNFLHLFMQLYHELVEVGPENILQQYTKRLYRLHGWFPYKDVSGTYTGQLLEVMADGRLVVLDRQQRRRVYAHKEVEFIIDAKAVQSHLEKSLK